MIFIFISVNHHLQFFLFLLLKLKDLLLLEVLTSFYVVLTRLMHLSLKVLSKDESKLGIEFCHAQEHLTEEL